MGQDAGSIGHLNKKIDSLTRNLLECYEELDLIYGLSRRGLTGLDIQSNLGFILDEAMEIFSGDMGWVVSADAGHFEPVRVRASSETVDRIQQAVVAGLLAEGKSRVLDCLGENGLGPDLTGAFLCSTIKTEETVYGALCVTRNSGKPAFTAGELKLAGVMASQAAIAIENALLHRRRLEEEQVMIRIQEEVRLARTIQQNLLPKTHPTVAGYDVAGVTLPAQSVGGDYYDLIDAGGSRVAICLGDVSGKGMPAALLMAHLQAAIRGQTLMAASPAECLNRSNTLLFQSTDSDRFATCFYGILDPREHTLRFSNAGHDRPLYIAERKVPASLSSAGLVLGILETVEYEEMTLTFGPGDTFLLYSDGIIDAADSEDRAFGLDRFIDLVQTHSRSTAREVVSAVLEEVQKHAGRNDFLDAATGTLCAAGSHMKQHAMATGQMLLALDFSLGPTREIVVTGEDSTNEVAEILGHLRRRYLPRKVVACRANQTDRHRSDALGGLFAGKQAQSDQSTLFVCENFACQEPVIGKQACFDKIDQL